MKHLRTDIIYSVIMMIIGLYVAYSLPSSAGDAAVISSWVGGLMFSVGVASFSHELWLLRRHARTVAALNLIFPRRLELIERIQDGESVDLIARDFRDRYGVPEVATTSLSLITVRQWLASDEPDDQACAKKFIARQTVDSREAPEAFLGRLKDENIGILVDEGVLLYYRPPSIAHIKVNEQPDNTIYDEVGTLLLTTAYLYFLSHTETPGRHAHNPWYIRIAKSLYKLLRTPFAAMFDFVKGFVPGLSEAVKLAEGLDMALARPFGPSRVKLFMKQFAYNGSFAIPLTEIDALALTRTFQPHNGLEMRIQDRNGGSRTMWFRSARSELNNSTGGRSWVTGQTESPEDWTNDWIERIRLIALGDGHVIADGPVRLPDNVAGQRRPAHIWNRGDLGPLSKTQARRQSEGADWAVLLIISLTFAIWLAPPIAVISLSFLTGVDPFELVGLGWGLLLSFMALLAWLLFLGVAISLAGQINHRYFPKVEPMDHPEHWLKGPKYIFDQADDLIRRLTTDPLTLSAVIEQNSNKFGSPTINSHLAFLEAILNGLIETDGRVAAQAREAFGILQLPDSAAPHDPLTVQHSRTAISMFRQTEATLPRDILAAASMKKNICLAKNISHNDHDDLSVRTNGVVLVGLHHVFVFAHVQSDNVLEFDDFDEFTPVTVERLTQLFVDGEGMAEPLRSLVEVRTTLKTNEQGAAELDAPARVQMFFGDSHNAPPLFEFNTDSYADAQQLMSILWCAAAGTGNVLEWSETDLRLMRSDLNFVSNQEKRGLRG